MRLLSVAPDIIALEGELPLLRGGLVIGPIGVSGSSSPERRPSRRQRPLTAPM